MNGYEIKEIEGHKAIVKVGTQVCYIIWPLEKFDPEEALNILGLMNIAFQDGIFQEKWDRGDIK